MIRIPDVLLGQRARAFESCDCSEIDVYGWAFLCPDTKVIVHSDGVTKYKIVPVTFPMPSAPKAGCISYNALYYIRCEDGKVYEYSPTTRTILRSFQVAQPDSTATSWISVSRSRYSSLTVQSVMYVLTQGASGELVAIRLPDGQMFRGGLGIGDLVGGVIDSTPGGNVENYPDSIPSQVTNPLTTPMGPLSCQVVTGQGVIASIQLTPLFGFVTKSVMQNTALSNVVRVMKPFASRMPPPPPIIPPDSVGYNSSYIMSVRLVVPTYGGPCLRVRRSSDNAEKDIWFYRGWLDETELLAFVGSGDGFVTAWYNQTPQYGLTKMVQTDSTKQPKLVSSGVTYKVGAGQRPCLPFDGTKRLIAPVGETVTSLLVYGDAHFQAVVCHNVRDAFSIPSVFSQYNRSNGPTILRLRYRFGLPGYTDFRLAECGLQWDSSPGPSSGPGPIKAVSLVGDQNYTPSLLPPSSFPEFAALAATSRLSMSHTRMRWKSASMGNGYKDSTPVQPIPSNRYGTALQTLETNIGCDPGQAGGLTQLGVQEIIAQTIAWSVADVDNMLENQEAVFK